MRSTLIAVYFGQTSALVSEHQTPHSVQWKKYCRQRNVVPTHTGYAQVGKTDSIHQHPHQQPAAAAAPTTAAPAAATTTPKFTTDPPVWRGPGAGVVGYNAIQPFTEVFKDGFLKVDCVKDAMYEHGDKFGNNKDNFKYNHGLKSTSIVHYTEKVPKEDREKMTYSVCFEFCRGIKDMSFFGIHNGRDCYCTPYFKAMASDSEICDSVCEGDESLTCGGKSKSQLFSMHVCDSTEDELAAAKQNGLSIKDKLNTLSTQMVDDTQLAQTKSDMMQKSLGQAGDPGASDILKKSRVWSGKNIAAGEKGKELVQQIIALETTTTGATGKDLSQYDNLNEVEDIIRQWGHVTSEAKRLFDDNVKMWELAQPPIDKLDLTNWDKHYRPIMHFVDKKHEAVPSTCTGELVDEPVLSYTANECAAACDSLVGRCVGFSFFWSDGGVCFLYSKFKAVQYYTGCEPAEPAPVAPVAPVAEFLQTNQLAVQKKSSSTQPAPFEAQCIAKLQFFEGTSLKANIKEANRCFK